MSGHKNCCKGRRAPKTVAEFAALNYPSNPTGKKDEDNRIHNPEHVPVTFKKDIHKRIRKGWWIRLKKDAAPVLLDGSGDGVSRGIVDMFGDPDVVPHGGARIVCLNAASLKKLPIEPGGKPVLCGFTWYNRLKDPPPPGTKKNFPPVSGWMPLSELSFKREKSRKKLIAALKSWSCCIKKYGEWGRRLAGKKVTKYTFRSADEFKAEIEAIVATPTKLKTYFKDYKGKILKRLGKAVVDPKGVALGVRAVLGVAKYCKGGNRVTDYMPKNKDYKNGWYTDGYTNFSGNVSVGKNDSSMAPIPIDTFPAGHEFHRLKFKKNRQVYGHVYHVPKKNPGKRIGKFIWYFGYCDIVSNAKAERRYGWVPALALQKA